MIISAITTIEQPADDGGGVAITGAVASISVNGGPRQEGNVELSIPYTPGDIGAYPSNNPDGYITSENVVFTTGNQNISGNKEFAARPTVNGTGVLLVGEAAGGGDVDTSNFYTNDNPSGFITGVDTSNFYTNDNPSGFITSGELVSYSNEEQAISGKKTFTDGLEVGSSGLSVLYVSSSGVGINNENPQASLDVSGLAIFSERPNVSGLPVLLSGDVDTSNFYTNDNPSGFITGGLPDAHNFTHATSGTDPLSPADIGAVAKSGDTMEGKLNLQSSTTGSAGLNIGFGTAPTSPVDGDVYISSNNLFFKIPAASPRQLAVTNATNAFNQPQIIDVSTTSSALRVTQRGIGEAFRVEDETTPDATAFVISNSGRVGIGVDPDLTAALTIDGGGLKFSDGSVQTTAASGVDTSNFYTNDNPSGFITGVDLSEFIVSNTTTGDNVPISGASQVNNIIAITQSAYNQLSFLTSGTVYIIVD
jgi:hypothetical protein